jgi:RecG-like helicase
LRQPSTSIKSISSFDTLQQSPHISKLESLTIATMPANTNVDELETSSKLQAQAVKEIYYSLDEDQSDTAREAELLSDLERERDVIRVLQGQKTGT